MSFHIKRVFSNFSNIHSIPKDVVFIKCSSDYITNKFLNSLYSNFYIKKIDYTFFHNTFKTDYIESININNNHLFTSSLSYFKPKHIINLDSTFNSNYVYENEHELINLKYDFYKSTSKIYNIFSNICKEASLKINYSKFYEFKNEFINYIFSKKTPNALEFKKNSYLVSSIGIDGFKTFSNYIPNGLNKVFILNDSFNLFKFKLFDEIIKKAISLNIPYEIYRNSFNPKIIDHIKIPSLNICLVSNNLLFNVKIPGIQINDYNFFNSIDSIETFLLENTINDLNKINETLNNHYLKISQFYENNLSINKFNKLIDTSLNLR